MQMSFGFIDLFCFLKNYRLWWSSKSELHALHALKGLAKANADGICSFIGRQQDYVFFFLQSISEDIPSIMNGTEIDMGP